MGLIGRGRYFEATRMMSLRDIKIGDRKGYKDLKILGALLCSMTQLMAGRFWRLEPFLCPLGTLYL